MVLDHFAYAFLEPGVGYYVFRLLGRFSYPIFMFLLIDSAGYLLKNRPERYKRYVLRVLLFAILSEPCFQVFIHQAIGFSSQNVLFSFLCVLLTIYAIHEKQWVKATLLFVLLPFVITSIGIDYGWRGYVLGVVGFIWWDKRGFKIGFGGLTTLLFFKYVRLGMITYLFMPFIFQPYDSTKSNHYAAYKKWFYYIFYPAHMLLFGIIKIFL